jgi:hypothetical protein
MNCYVWIGQLSIEFLKKEEIFFGLSSTGRESPWKGLPVALAASRQLTLQIVDSFEIGPKSQAYLIDG